MKMKNTGNVFLILLLLILSACVEPFDSPVNGLSNNYLVVEGIISHGKSTIQLSRTSNLNEGNGRMETNARVYIENETGSHSYALDEIEEGVYEVDVDLNPEDQYRLKIHTTNESEYVSDFVSLVASPEIDSITWEVINDEVVQLHVTTHDPENNTRYYRWTYEETWQYHSPFYSNLDYVEGEVVYRDFTNNAISDCWQSASSTNILVNSTVRLQEDVVYKQPLLAINTSSNSRLDVKYSMLVRQYALTKEAFEYWDLLKKNTENMGTLFDPQPSQLPGNLHCTTQPDEPVLGFVSAGAVAEKRLFIRRSEIPISIPYNRNPSCTIDTIPASPTAVENAFAPGDTIPLNPVYGFGGIEGYQASSSFCVDCRTRGGTNVEPDFWE